MTYQPSLFDAPEPSSVPHKLSPPVWVNDERRHVQTRWLRLNAVGRAAL